MTERATNHIPIEDFQTGVDNFEHWIKLFEAAVVLSTNPQTEARKEALYKEWLPLKLDRAARSIYENKTKTGWGDLKTELKGLFVDPQDKYNWKTQKDAIVWDGVESFHTLATRIKRAVDMFDDDLPKAGQYFIRFRGSLPPDYRRAIDLRCIDEKQTIEEAKKVATIIRTAIADSGETVQGKTVAFTGASMSEDRLKAIEMGVQGLNVRMDNVESKHKSRDREKDTARGGYSSSRERYESRRSDDRGDRSESRGRGYGRDDRYRQRYDRSDSRDQRFSRDRGRYDRGRRDYSGRRDDSRLDYRGSRGYRGGRDSSRDRYGRDRGYSRDRYGSRDRDYGRGRYESRERDQSRGRYEGRDGNRRGGSRDGSRDGGRRYDPSRSRQGSQDRSTDRRQGDDGGGRTRGRDSELTYKGADFDPQQLALLCAALEASGLKSKNE